MTPMLSYLFSLIRSNSVLTGSNTIQNSVYTWFTRKAFLQRLYNVVAINNKISNYAYDK